MRRALLLGIAGTVLFSLATAMIVASVFLETTAVAKLPATSGAEVVRRFYAAVNDAIATGDPSVLDAVVAPHFVEDGSLPGAQPGLQGLKDYLVNLHAADPDMRLAAEIVTTPDDRVMAHVAIRPGQNPASLAGVVIDQSASWRPVETFRIAGGAIVERQDDGDGLAVALPLTEVALDMPVPVPRNLAVERLTIDPGARWGMPRPTGPRLLYVEDGSLAVDITAAPALAGSREKGADERASGDLQSATLTAGNSMVIPAGATLETENIGSNTTRVLVVDFRPDGPGGWQPGLAALPDGVTAQMLAGGWATDVQSGSVVLTVGQIMLTSGARASVSSAQGPVWLALDTGRLNASAWGDVWFRRPDGSINDEFDEALLSASDWLLLHPDSLAAFENASEASASILVLALRQESRAPATPNTT